VANSRRRLAAALFAVLLLACTGCAGSVQRWIVNARVHQGEVALDDGNVRDAELSYRLALRVDPTDVRARSGFVRAAAGLAQALYAKGDFDDALATIGEGLAIDPESLRLAALKTTIEQARFKREIAISNYPTYRESGLQIARAYAQLDATNKLLLKSLQRFGYTFDSNDLTDAIKRSYELQLDVAKNTNRLIIYRQLVTSGIPEAAEPTTTQNAPSLLPLP
jgi:tetratricopeptide (TPR) repeat protein